MYSIPNAAQHLTYGAFVNVQCLKKTKFLHLSTAYIPHNYSFLHIEHS